MSGVTIMMVDDETEILKLMEIYVKNEGLYTAHRISRAGSAGDSKNP